MNADQVIQAIFQTDSEASDAMSSDESNLVIENEDFSEDEIQLDDEVIQGEMEIRTSTLVRSNTFNVGDTQEIENSVDKLFFNKSKDFVWHSKEQFINHSSFKTFPPSLTHQCGTSESILEFFNLLIDYDMLNSVSEYTNLRMPRNEVPTNEVELRSLIGLLLFFGVTKKKHVDINEIWSTDSVHHMDYATATMTRDRFKLLCKKITFDDVNTRIERKNDKLGKIKEFFEKFQFKIKNLLKPGHSLCVDEQLYSYRGRCSFKQYMPSKPAKYGIKYWTICDVQSSYVLQSKIYAGKNNSNNTSYNIGENVVVNLAELYFNDRPRTLTADNFFSSINLASLLTRKNIFYIGTLRKNKKELPIEFLNNFIQI